MTAPTFSSSRLARPPVDATRDDDAILRAVLAEMTEDWFYAYDDTDDLEEGEKPKQKYQISARGAVEYARIRGDLGFPIRFPYGTSLRQTTHDGDVGVEATVVARDAKSGAESTAYIFRPHYTGTATNRQRDEHNDRAAASEANRNAILKLIPLVHIAAMLAARARVTKANAKRFRTATRKAIAEQIKRTPKIETLTEAQTKALADKAGDPYDTESA